MRQVLARQGGGIGDARRRIRAGQDGLEPEVPRQVGVDAVARHLRPVAMDELRLLLRRGAQ